MVKYFLFFNCEIIYSEYINLKKYSFFNKEIYISNIYKCYYYD